VGMVCLFPGRITVGGLCLTHLPSSFPVADKSVICEMDRERNVGSVKCMQCSASFAVKIHALSEAIDVYRHAGALGVS
jgi:Transcription elongation factor Elf1 like